MTYSNNSLSHNLELDLLRSMIIVVTIVFCVLGLFEDINPTHNFSIWMYFLAMSPILFLFSLFLKNYMKITILMLNTVLIVMAVSLVYFFFSESYYFGNDLKQYRIKLLLLNLVMVNFFFLKAAKTLQIDDAEADLSMYHPTREKNTAYRKLTRRRNRRANSQTKNNVKVKSGQYRG